MKASDLTTYCKAFEEDKQLSVRHMAILVALFLMADRQGRSQQIKVSRSKIMTLSHISTLPTYHKYSKELQEMGYICYRPSYHPGVRSEIDFMIRLADKFTIRRPRQKNKAHREANYLYGHFIT